ncbi:N-acetylglucosaminyl deacetylase, LmbE family [Aquiflexum balticum DSM 16537]|uniref:N-acetylglucosaminyl deacetylase, LmbE family n=1 Tax=Aquiflexum balticum DSM 16537 TaxID=758820 RepID=A0A1W2H971_9BACT|nr:PIG-L deacetylase family protein [Aquiflexum balticum]SMD45238.1 N-acetylglucosaminyl deacetylase, LmbE family [Aquiflexum balticum DSM 16537]
MKNAIILTILLFHFFSPAKAQDRPLNIIMIGAHPDDCDIKGGGTAAHFAELGHKVKFISVTNGDAGHMEQGGGVLAKRRVAETQEVARILGITYEVLDNHDGELLATLPIRLEIIRTIRDWNADVVISHRTNDYHPDHRYTAILVQDAAYMVGVPNIAADTPPLKKNPVFLYFQDNFQKPIPFKADIAIDITAVIDKKIDALNEHESQFYEWLPWIGGYADEVPEGKGARKAWLKEKRISPVNPASLALLQKWYGKEKAQNVQHVELFEICEYGSRPTEDDIRRLFPMIGR